MSLGFSQRQGASARSGFTLHLQIRNESSGTPVVYKPDGARFSGSNNTVKFVQGQSYVFSLVCIPDMAIESCTLCPEDERDVQMLERWDLAPPPLPAPSMDAAQHYNIAQPSQPMSTAATVLEKLSQQAPAQLPTAALLDDLLIDLEDDQPPQQPQLLPPTMQQPLPADPNNPFAAPATLHQPAKTSNPFTAPDSAVPNAASGTYQPTLRSNPWTTRPAASNPFTEPIQATPNPFTTSKAAPPYPYNPPYPPAPSPPVHNPFTTPTAPAPNPFAAPAPNPFNTTSAHPTAHSQPGQYATTNPFTQPSATPTTNPFQPPTTTTAYPSVTNNNPFLATTTTALPAVPSSNPFAAPQQPTLVGQDYNQVNTPPHQITSYQAAAPPQLPSQPSSTPQPPSVNTQPTGSSALASLSTMPSAAVSDAAPKAPSAAGTHHWVWQCDWPASVKSTRTQLKLQLKTQELGIAELPLLAKIYKEVDKQQYNGSKLRHVQFLLTAHPQYEHQAKVISSSFFGLP